MTRTLQPEEIEALREYAKQHGRNWKSELRIAWYYAREPGILQSLRNDPNFGHKGLDKFRLSDYEESKT